VEPWLQARKYVAAVASGLAKRNGWTIAEQAGDRTPERTQRLLNRAAWDTFAAMGVVRRFAVAGLDEAARRRGRRRGLRVGAIDETSQQKHGTCTAGVTRHYLGCAGKVANGITMVHLSCVRERTGHALIGTRQWIPREQIEDPVKSLIMGLPGDLVFRTKGQLAIDICTEAFTDGTRLDFVCGDEVYGTCTELRESLETRRQGYVLRVPSSFRLRVARGVTMTCGQAVTRLLTPARSWEIRSAGTGSKGQRWYAWAWLAASSPRHCLLVRRHLHNGELAFHYCYVPDGRPVSKARLIRAAGLRWPVEEDFGFGKDCFGLDQSQVRLYIAIARHAVLVMAALAACAVTAALLRDRTDTQAPPPVRPGQPPPADPGMIPLTVPEIKRLLTVPPASPRPPGHAEHRVNWRRRHQARSRWYHQRARLARDAGYALASLDMAVTGRQARHPPAAAFQSRSSMMTPLGSRTWKARSPHSSDLSGMVTVTPSASSRASSPSRLSTSKARISPQA
jgi:SRSO17 transposase